MRCHGNARTKKHPDLGKNMTTLKMSILNQMDKSVSYFKQLAKKGIFQTQSVQTHFTISNDDPQANPGDYLFVFDE